METILLFQVEDKREIAALAANMRIRLKEVNRMQYHQKLKEILDQTPAAAPASGEGEALPGSMMIFCGVSDKHLERILFAMRKKNVRVDYKAVLTPSNQSWTPYALFAQLEMERRAYESAGK